MNKKPNIILITADSLRADYCGFINRKRKHLTPFLNRLFSESNTYIFKNAYANGPYTPAAMPAIHTGTQPIFLGGFKIRNRITISEILKYAGYKTIGLVELNPFASYYSGKGRGFDIFREIPNPPKMSTNLPIQKDSKHISVDFSKTFLKVLINPTENNLSLFISNIRKMTHLLAERFSSEFTHYFTKFMLDSLRFLKYRVNIENIMHSIKLPEMLLRFYEIIGEYDLLEELRSVLLNSMPIMKGAEFEIFLWMHLMKTHIPYSYSVNFEDLIDAFVSVLEEVILYDKGRAGIVSKEDITKLQSFYAEGVKTLDKTMRLIIETLEETQILDSGFLIFLSDHGEELFENGLFEHPGCPTEESLRIPLAIVNNCDHLHNDEDFHPNSNSLASQVDILPTILEVLNNSQTNSKIGKIVKMLEGLLSGYSLLSEFNTHKYISSEGVYPNSLVSRKLWEEIVSHKPIHLPKSTEGLVIWTCVFSKNGSAITYTPKFTKIPVGYSLSAGNKEYALAKNRLEEIITIAKDHIKSFRYRQIRKMCKLDNIG